MVTGQGNYIFLQGLRQVRECCKMVMEILKTKKVREKSGYFLILAQNCSAVAGILSVLNDMKPCNFFLAQSTLLQNNVHFRKCMPKNFKTFYFSNRELGQNVLCAKK